MKKHKLCVIAPSLVGLVTSIIFWYSIPLGILNFIGIMLLIDFFENETKGKGE